MVNNSRPHKKRLIIVKEDEEWVMGALIKQSAVSWYRGSFVACRDKSCGTDSYKRQKSEAKKARQVDFGPFHQPSTYLCPWFY